MLVWFNWIRSNSRTIRKKTTKKKKDNIRLSLLFVLYFVYLVCFVLNTLESPATPEVLMKKLLQTSFALAAAVILISSLTAAQPVAAPAMRIAYRPVTQRAINADVVVVGKVTALEKDLVQAASSPGAKDTVGYKIAVVKIDSTLAGANKLTEIKVGFIPPAKPDPNANPANPPVRPIRPIGRIQAPELKEGQELILFLAKHPSGDFYVIPAMTPPVDLTTEQGKKDLENVKKVTEILADPTKALKSDKPEDRSEAATVVIMKYRSFPASGGETEQVAIPVEESKQILKALTDGEWSNLVRTATSTNLNPVQAFYSLGLTDKDGWIAPVVAPAAPGSAPVDFNAIQKDAFLNWLEGPGKNYQIKKVVPKVQK
jgi:hypothetical protein